MNSNIYKISCNKTAKEQLIDELNYKGDIQALYDLYLIHNDLLDARLINFLKRKASPSMIYDFLSILEKNIDNVNINRLHSILSLFQLLDVFDEGKLLFYKTVKKLVHLNIIKNKKNHLAHIVNICIRSRNISLLSQYNNYFKGNDYYDAFRHRIKDISFLLEPSEFNHKFLSYKKKIINGEVITEKVSKDDVIIYIPDSFFISDSQWVDVHDYINKCFIEILESLEGKKIVPYFQYMNGGIFRFDDDINKIYSYHSISKGKKNNINFKESHLKGYFNMDPDGYSGWSSLPSKWSDEFIFPEAADFYDNIYTEFVINKKSKYKQNDLIESNLPKDFVFYPMQVFDDKVSEHAYINTIQLLDEIKYISEKLDVKFIVKRHPMCTNDFVQEKIENIVASSDNIACASGDIHELIKKSKCVLTVNSGVGFEALLQLKKVIMTGNSDYNVVASTCKNRSELLSIFEQYEKIDTKVDEKLIKNFLYWYLHENCKKVILDEK